MARLVGPDVVARPLTTPLEVVAGHLGYRAADRALGAAGVSGVVRERTYPPQDLFYAGILPVHYIPPSPYNGDPKTVVVTDNRRLATTRGELEFLHYDAAQNNALWVLNVLLAHRGEGLVHLIDWVEQHGFVAPSGVRRGREGQAVFHARERLDRALGVVGISITNRGPSGVMLEPGLVVVDQRPAPLG